jgi:hypothetical protein
MNSSTYRDVTRFLSRIGVDTRFLSIFEGNIYINNQRFSRFTSKRQELFTKNFSNFTIHKSKVFQKICTRASRVLAKSLKPGEKIFIPENDKCSTFVLEMILEPYTRKYGIKIFKGDDMDHEIDSIALPLTLDDEAENVVNCILNGNKIEVYHLINDYSTENQTKIIYPLQNVPCKWIKSWMEKLDQECEYSMVMNVENDTLNFLEEFIPDVRENILKSALFISEEFASDKKIKKS